MSINDPRRSPAGPPGPPFAAGWLLWIIVILIILGIFSWGGWWGGWWGNWYGAPNVHTQSKPAPSTTGSGQNGTTAPKASAPAGH